MGNKSQKAHLSDSAGGMLMVVVLITSFLLMGFCTCQQEEQQQGEEGRNRPSTSSSPPPYSSSSSPPPYSSSSSPPPYSSSSRPPYSSSRPPYSSPRPPPYSTWSPPPYSSSSSPRPPPYSTWSPPPYSSSSPPPYISSRPPYSSSPLPSPPPSPYSSSPPPSSSSMCINQLLPCLNFINGDGNGNSRNGESKPSGSCCDPLKEMIKSNPECLCNMITIKGTDEAERAGINVTRAQQLPARCGQRVNPISCLTSTGFPGSKISNSANSFSSQNFVEAFTVLMISWAIFSCTT